MKGGITLNALRDKLARACHPGSISAHKTRGVLISCVVVFCVAFGVRLLHMQDAAAKNEEGQSLITSLNRLYRYDAQRIDSYGGALFPENDVDPTDARMIVHPPGYSMLMVATVGSNGPASRLVVLQIFFDSFAAVLVLLIAAELFSLGTAVVASSLAALSPHLSFYSLWLTPDSLAAVPILAAIFFLLKAMKEPNLVYIGAAGALLGLSCWFRSNALLLPLFLGIFCLLLFPRNRLRYGAVLLGTALLVISPITIRNWVVYRQFVPLSLGAGITMIEGIADYDKGGKFGMPRDDKATSLKDAEWHNRPEYAANLWTPDGIQRDRYRFGRGLQVVREEPVWFLGVMARRMGFMLRYNGGAGKGWPFDTVLVPIVSLEPGFGHSVSSAEGLNPHWTQTPHDLFANGTQVAPNAETEISQDNSLLLIKADDSRFGDQFMSEAIPVQMRHDYILEVPITDGRMMALKVTSEDQRITLASAIIGTDSDRRERKASQRKRDKRAEREEPDSSEVSNIRLPFASGERNKVKLVVSNDGPIDGQPRISMGNVDVIEVGPTPLRWTAYPRYVIRVLQRSLFKTGPMLTLIATGVLLLVVAGSYRRILIVAAVPLYYLTFQSALHTEYRYILAMHYFLFVFAAVTIAVGCKLLFEMILLTRLSQPFRKTV